MSTVEKWWAASGDKRIGPLTSEELQRLLVTGALAGDTIVWTPSFGDDWKPLSEVRFSRLHDEPPPLPFGTVRRTHRHRAEEGASINGQASPPSVAADDRYAWAIVAVPVAASVFDYILAVSGMALDTRQMLIAGLIPYPFLVLFDDYQQHKAHNDDRLLPIQFWWILIPVYLFMRARALGQPLTLLWAWLMSLFASLVLASSLGSA